MADNNTGKSSSSLRGQVLPNNVEAEKSVLGCALANEKNLNTIAANLQDTDFYEPRHQFIFRAMLNLMSHGRPIDILTVYNALDGDKLADKVGGMPYISELLNQPPLIKNIDEYVSIVKEKSALRRLAVNMSEIIDLCLEQKENSELVINRAAEKIFQMRDSNETSGLEILKSVLSRKIEDMMENRHGSRSVPTGFASLDRITNGLTNGTMTILAARPGVGKSSFALNIATNIAVNQQGTVAVFSLEMSKEELATRILASFAGINSMSLQRNNISSGEMAKISAAVVKLMDAKLFIDDRVNCTPMEILAKCRQLKQEHSLSLVIVDYLQLMSLGSGRRNDSRQQEVSEISRSMKLIAKELDVPVLALSQLSRSSEQRKDEGGAPKLSDLRESGSLEQDADIVMFIVRKNSRPEEQQEQEAVELHIAKNRAGGLCNINLGWIPRFTRFYDIETATMQPPPEAVVSQDLPMPPGSNEELYPFE
ncbi:replicative DNA helicase [Mageeibacillus indolicus]|jgi:hypothetical protein|uniref:Replicative DNA helicase n=2 Tax=Mageeibacillus indolicus TaxID=884684 RepID=D3R210_MAGIU|nr:replicative DNA helicase [Mageeibacillus indolicus]ADC91694.1 replicative DNA helicase [Mageeibacillus indolicus UPII9-5]PNH19701.1 replicative DNA helicase [Mageeibacillus indolicus]